MPFVSKTTAYQHRSEAMTIQHAHLPPPQLRSTEESETPEHSSSNGSRSSSENSPSSSSPSSSSDAAEKDDESMDGESERPILDRTISTSCSSPSTPTRESQSEDFDEVSDELSNEDSIESSANESNDFLDDENLDRITQMNPISAAEERLKRTMTRCLWILKFRLKYHLVDEAVDYLIKREKALYPDDVLISTFKGLKKAICKYASLDIKSSYCCDIGHKALGVLEDGSIEQCDHKLCKSRTSQVCSVYKSFSLWDQLRILIQSPEYGPLLFEYHQDRLRNLNLDLDEEEEWYTEFLRRFGL